MVIRVKTESVARALARRAEQVTGEPHCHLPSKGGWEVRAIHQPHCYQCDRPVNYLFPDGRCSRCTRV